MEAAYEFISVLAPEIIPLASLTLFVKDTRPQAAPATSSPESAMGS